ncbi:MAG: hypothetical protein A3F90_06420 [Deltaproteobacteria bacterium RIFCSPLOWO2_12_FULL_60_19]|nr:MAG: hypothetical protein A3F90_06420 [Deltaproteobacteria bacterium RIFCSPLOWO2_12_FULL_60_19]
MRSLFITGATGFIGRSLLSSLDLRAYEIVYCLARRPLQPFKHSFRSENVQFVTGSLEQPETWAPLLTPATTVVHLAAATGKTAPERYFSVNTKGTESLLSACRKANSKNFLYVSSIAAKFPDKRRYPYARSKELAEEAVKRSGIRYTIIRPTVVIGRDAPLWQGLLRLARQPIILLPGDGRTRIQPIYIDDLVACLGSILDENIFADETFEVGGPEAIAIEDFIGAVHARMSGKRPKVIHVPLKPMLSLLGLLEPGLRHVLPVTAGQLSAFYQDGTIEPNRLFRRHSATMKRIPEMLNLVLNDE